MRRRAYSPYGYCISPLPTFNGRFIRHILSFFYLDRQKKPYFRGLAFRSQRCFEAPWGYNATETGECQGNDDTAPRAARRTVEWRAKEKGRNTPVFLYQII